MRARFIKQIGTRGRLRIYWDKIKITEITPCNECPHGHPKRLYLDECPNSYGRGKPGIHNAYTAIGDKPGDDYRSFGSEQDYPEDMWPKKCSHCDKEVPQTAAEPTLVGQEGIFLVKQVFTDRLYDNPSGEPEPGDVFYLRSHDPGDCHYWDNCDGMHLKGICPNGDSWDMDSRAANCTMKSDKNHRCWVRHGSPENGTIDVGKNGNTCAAGAGSIQTEGWHGFLRNGDWI